MKKVHRTLFKVTSWDQRCPTSWLRQLAAKRQYRENEFTKPFGIHTFVMFIIQTSKHTQGRGPMSGAL